MCFWCTYELTLVKALRKSVQAHDKPDSNMGRRVVYKIPPSEEALLTVVSSWERERLCFLRV